MLRQLETVLLLVLFVSVFYLYSINSSLRHDIASYKGQYNLLLTKYNKAIEDEKKIKAGIEKLTEATVKDSKTFDWKQDISHTDTIITLKRLCKD